MEYNGTGCPQIVQKLSKVQLQPLGRSSFCLRTKERYIKLSGSNFWLGYGLNNRVSIPGTRSDLWGPPSLLSNG